MLLQDPPTLNILKHQNARPHGPHSRTRHTVLANGEADYEAIYRLGSWLGSIDGVQGLVVLGHAGEGTFLTQEEQCAMIGAFRGSLEKEPEVVSAEAKRAVETGAQAGFLYPSHGWVRFGYQPGAPQDRYRRVYELTDHARNFRFAWCLRQEEWVRNTRRWDTGITVIHDERPEFQILTCHKEYSLHTAFDDDGMLVRYRDIAPELLLELIDAGKAKDYVRARAAHDRLLPVTKPVYHRGSHMEGTVALKHVLAARGILNDATVRSPLFPLPEGAEAEIHAAVTAAALPMVVAAGKPFGRAAGLPKGMQANGTPSQLHNGHTSWITATA
ncbi:dihydrodipicolinate synthase [Exophiala aquamarina CBS 119918]|uniref:Dihydrodipicolinate synthase n=1 Tax=Exophiala aquamarina CBS 119918 TaxID=1182545 RepID=A0A072PPG1_9EURO|nr:dihydrodipicolinate synthase [Exophiala aquamarina CBS 119918]KEF57385.1 dihydrodipicolinate synthase [Exophiala aquamarina CBS 119918]